ncbi:hypothetical protein NIIDMKKI_75810 [Mycobacterium kansasii]|uniref:AB hydrolase-1 domain-containing protein n=1 Tax=Mycobacterium kansasii TaxID=1768 RepID=A0A7G1IRH1_MYCKA|nr:hypothetical protein NIIDMKKI_75810 [Mycobacterium kansasii]
MTRRVRAVTEISDDELTGLSEFDLLAENAEQAGATGPLPAVERVEADTAGGRISALRWGGSAPRVVFLHGGGQNAHTWDTVIVGLGEPALAVDLPGHGHSGWREDGDYSPQHNADALAPVLRGWHRRPNSSSGCRWAGSPRSGWARSPRSSSTSSSSSTSPRRRCSGTPK